MKSLSRLFGPLQKLFFIFLFSELVFSQDNSSYRPSVAIAALEKSAVTPAWFDEAAFRSMLETAVVSTNKFRLIERSQLNSIAGERELVQQGSVRAGGVSDKVDAADYLIYGRVTQFNFAGLPTGEQGVASLLGQLIVGAPPEKPQPFMMSVDLKITDLKSGAVRYADSISKKEMIQRIKNRSPLALPVVTEIQREVAEKIARELSFTVFPVRVIEVKKQRVTLNYGAGMLAVGDILSINNQGSPIVDPYTKEILGASESTVAEVVIEEVAPRFSLGKVKRGKSQDIAIGAIARIAPVDVAAASRKN